MDWKVWASGVLQLFQIFPICKYVKDERIKRLANLELLEPYKSSNSLAFSNKSKI
jgi:hypothetical protein